MAVSISAVDRTQRKPYCLSERKSWQMRCLNTSVLIKISKTLPKTDWTVVRLIRMLSRSIKDRTDRGGLPKEFGSVEVWLIFRQQLFFHDTLIYR